MPGYVKGSWSTLFGMPLDAEVAVRDVCRYGGRRGLAIHVAFRPRASDLAVLFGPLLNPLVPDIISLAVSEMEGNSELSAGHRVVTHTAHSEIGCQ